MNNDARVEIAKAYLEGLSAKDLSQVPFAPDVTFESPITPRLTGIQSVLEFLEGVFSVIKAVRVQQCVADGEYVVAHFELDTTYGLIPVTDRIGIVDGQIAELRPYYDPRPLGRRAGRSGSSRKKAFLIRHLPTGRLA
jgi:hypothetical protein